MAPFKVRVVPIHLELHFNVDALFAVKAFYYSIFVQTKNCQYKKYGFIFDPVNMFH